MLLLFGYESTEEMEDRQMRTLIFGFAAVLVTLNSSHTVAEEPPSLHDILTAGSWYYVFQTKKWTPERGVHMKNSLLDSHIHTFKPDGT